MCTVVTELTGTWREGGMIGAIGDVVFLKKSSISKTCNPQELDENQERLKHYIKHNGQCNYLIILESH